MSYRPRSQADDEEAFEAELRSFVDRDLQRGFTTHGPHRDDFRLEAAGLDLRRFGSQGQQRLALLALLLAEREALAEKRAEPPVMLLDDVLSELDLERRRLLLEALRAGGQALMTTADPDAAWAAGGEVTSVRVSEGAIG
jgi:DNA replication and repair protein RecF